jgi:hypothetical protein
LDNGELATVVVGVVIPVVVVVEVPLPLLPPQPARRAMTPARARIAIVRLMPAGPG